jgi:hypothetical protein
MTTLSGSPKTQKGAIVGLDPFGPLASVIVFQYHPDTRHMSGKPLGTRVHADQYDSQMY